MLLSLPNSSAVAYTDDITVIASGTIINSVTSYLQDLQNTIYTWSVRNALHLNIAKSFVMHVMPSLRHHRSADVSVYLGSCRLAHMHQLSLLGVLLSNDLSLTSQACKVKFKIASRIAAIWRFGQCLNSKTRLLAYNALCAYTLPTASLCGAIPTPLLPEISTKFLLVACSQSADQIHQRYHMILLPIATSLILLPKFLSATF